jgi:trans-aconitate 2-methyltransferase
LSWSPAQYALFEAERNRPIHDLIARIPTDPVATAIDLGCGPGNSTELIARRYPDAAISGFDSSAAMIDAARQRLPDIAFTRDDITGWSAGQGAYDLILANAALQWVPDHATLFPALMQRLTPGGTLAVQMPDNLDEPSHRLMREVAAEGPWADRLSGAATARHPRHQADHYYALLRDPADSVDIWRTTYMHVLQGGAHAIVEWVKATGLRPYIDPLHDGERQDFLALYEAAIARAYPVFPDGTVLLPFPRLFIVARRAA